MAKNTIRPEIRPTEAKALVRCLEAGLTNRNYIFNEDEIITIDKFMDKIRTVNEREELIKLLTQNRESNAEFQKAQEQSQPQNQPLPFTKEDEASLQTKTISEIQALIHFLEDDPKFTLHVARMHEVIEQKEKE